jgi:hypothetical protein
MHLIFMSTHVTLRLGGSRQRIVNKTLKLLLSFLPHDYERRWNDGRARHR